MAWPNIDVNVPTGSEKKKFGDDRIRESKQNTVDAMQAISNFTPAGTQPALRTAVWTTATRPSGADLVDRVTGFNTDLALYERYDLTTTSWKAIASPGLSSWTVTGRPTSPYTGQYGYNTDLAVIERWSGSAWVRISGGRHGDIKMWSGAINDIETGWCLADGVQRTHPEGGNFTPPNLRDRFIVGAGYSYAVGATGGEAYHTLTIAEIPSHDHPYIGISDSGGGGRLNASTTSGNYANTFPTGGGGAHENRPPFYALCFLYKL